jgi:hypothetical protein
LGETFRDEILIANAKVLAHVNIFCGSDPVVMTTAHNFATAFLGNKDIPSSDIKVEKDLLDNSTAADHLLNEVSGKLKLLVREGDLGTPAFAWAPSMPEPAIIWDNLVELLKTLRKAMSQNFPIRSKLNIQPRWCSGQDETLFKDRWDTIFANLCDSAEIRPDQVIELYDNLKFDAIHNRQFLEFCFSVDSSLLDGDGAMHERHVRDTRANNHFPLRTLNKLYELCNTLFDYIFPQQYGISSDEKLEIGLLYSLPLLQEMVRDIEELQASQDESSFFYFTTRSHIYTLLNCLLEGSLQVRMRPHELANLDSLSGICFELYENENKTLDDSMDRYAYSIKITLSRGCHAYEPLNVFVLHRPTICSLVINAVIEPLTQSTPLETRNGRI